MKWWIVLVLCTISCACAVPLAKQQKEMPLAAPLALTEVDPQELSADEWQAVFTLIKGIYEKTIRHTASEFYSAHFDLTLAGSETTEKRVVTVAAIYPESVLAAYKDKSELETQLRKKAEEVGFEWVEDGVRRHIELTEIHVEILNASECSNIGAGKALVAVIPLRVRRSKLEKIQCGG